MVSQKRSYQLSSALRNGTLKSLPFLNHLFNDLLQTESFEIGKEGELWLSLSPENRAFPSLPARAQPGSGQPVPD
jgi:hypothetical protein